MTAPDTDEELVHPREETRKVRRASQYAASPPGLSLCLQGSS